MTDRAAQWTLYAIALMLLADGTLLIAQEPTHPLLGLLSFAVALSIAAALGTWRTKP